MIDRREICHGDFTHVRLNTVRCGVMRERLGGACKAQSMRETRQQEGTQTTSSYQNEREGFREKYEFQRAWSKQHKTLILLPFTYSDWTASADAVIECRPGHVMVL